jgi:hypothetical protein
LRIEENVVSVALRVTTTVQPGHKIEITAPELPEGSTATVLVMTNGLPVAKRSFRAVLADYPAAPSFQSAEEADRYLREERDAWDS